MKEIILTAKFRLSALIALLAICITAQAAIASHVQWSAEIEQTAPDKAILKIHADIEDGWHIYGLSMPSLPDGSADVLPDPTSIEIEAAPGLTVADSTMCSEKPQIHFDDFMSLNLPWLKGKLTLSRELTLAEGTSGAHIRGYVSYMACTDVSCTPPARYEFDLTMGNPDSSVAIDVETDKEAETETITSSNESTGNSSSQWWTPVETDNESSGEGRSYWAIFLLGFLGGLVALMTPCVWPMIPMTVSFFLKSGKTRRRAIADASLYSGSIIFIFLALGLLITLIFGPGKLNEIATGAVFNVIFFLLLVVFAISFFGAFEIKLPSRWATAVDNRAEQTTGIVSIFFMAFTLVLVSFSCTGPIIGTLLVEAFTDSNLMGPLLGMGGFALGLALPFGLFAFFPSMLKELPRSGSWLNTVKVVLGFVELILSLKVLSVADLAYGWGILDREVFLALWIVLFILLGLYLLGKLRFSHDAASAHTSVGGFFGAVASLAFAIYLIPGLWGAPLKAISAFAPPLYTQDFNLYGGEFKVFDDYDEGMRFAAESHKPVLLDFSGYACVNCRKMEGAVFDTPEVREIIERDYVMITLMVDDKTPLPHPITVEEQGKTVKLRTVGDRWSFLQRHKFGISSQPYYIQLDNNGMPLMAPRAYDENVGDFVKWLENGVSAYKD